MEIIIITIIIIINSSGSNLVNRLLYDSSFEKWFPTHDLLNSNQFSKDFVVEKEKDNTIKLRFFDATFSDFHNFTKSGYGDMDGCNCQQNYNSANDYLDFNVDNTLYQIYGHGNRYKNLYGIYRVGNGRSGNVGNKTITCFKLENRSSDTPYIDDSIFENTVPYTYPYENDISEIYNPLPAMGGRDPEDMSNIREFVPWSFRKQMRVVTKEDYETILREGIPEIQKASVDIIWTGSWYTVFVLVDIVDRITFSDSLKTKIKNYLENYRLTGYDIHILEPIYVPIYIEINICVKENYNKISIKQKILEELSNRVLSNGERGLFHRDEWTFGQSVSLSNIYERIFNIEGLSSLEIVGFRRLNESQKDELESGLINVERDEIVILDNNPSFPEKGRIVINFDEMNKQKGKTIVIGEVKPRFTKTIRASISGGNTIRIRM